MQLKNKSAPFSCELGDDSVRERFVYSYRVVYKN